MISLKFIENIYNVIYISIYIAYITAFINLQVFSDNYRDIITPYVTLFVSLFLVVRFNPLVNPTYTKFDKRVIFDAALFLLMSTIITNGYLFFATEFHQKFI